VQTVSLDLVAPVPAAATTAPASATTTITKPAATTATVVAGSRQVHLDLAGANHAAVEHTNSLLGFDLLLISTKPKPFD
jgi:hypothetical protein